MLSGREPGLKRLLQGRINIELQSVAPVILLDNINIFGAKPKDYRKI